MTLFEIVSKAHAYDDEAMLLLISRFSSLFRHYSKKNGRQNEDMYDDLVTDLIQAVHETKIVKLTNKSDNQIYGYFRAVLHNSFADRIRKQIDLNVEIVFSAFTEANISDFENKTAEEDIYFHDEFLTPLDVLTPTERQLMQKIYMQNISISKIAIQNGKTRQSVNQMKLSALHKLGQAITEKERTDSI